MSSRHLVSIHSMWSTDSGLPQEIQEVVREAWGSEEVEGREGMEAVNCCLQHLQEMQPSNLRLKIFPHGRI